MVDGAPELVHEYLHVDSRADLPGLLGGGESVCGELPAVRRVQAPIVGREVLVALGSAG
jgi:hypothetical protein